MVAEPFDPTHFESDRDQQVGDRREELIVLADEVRLFVDAVVRTQADADALHEVAEELAPLREKLEPLRNEPVTLEVEDLRQGSRLYNPVIGLANPFAPPLKSWVVEKGRVEGEVTLGLTHEGPPLHTHGGVVALLFDQLLGHAASADGTPGMTVALELRFRKPTPYGLPLKVTAEVTHNDGRKVISEGRIEHDGVVTAEAKGVFLSPRLKQD